MSETYKCAMCGTTREKASDEAANAEAKELWGVDNASTDPDFAIICDDCFNRRTPEERKAMGKEFKHEREA